MKRYLIAGVVLLALALGALSASSAQATPKPPTGQLSFDQSSYDFGAVAVGRTHPADFVLTFTSSGKTAAKVTASLGASSGPFAITANKCAKGGLKPNKTCTITVSYAPTTVGSNDSATLTASATGLDSVSVSLAGQGKANAAPTANGDSVTTAADTPLTIDLEGSDPDGDYLTFEIATGPSHGTLGTPTTSDCMLALGGPGTCYGSVTYTPNTGYEGADTFTYRANDGLTTSTAATVSVTVTGGSSGTCTAGSENFSDDNSGSQPTTFSGGTIDTTYGPIGAIYIQGSGFAGYFPTGTHVLYTGNGVNSFALSFTNAVSSVQLDAQSNSSTGTMLTLTAYDASNQVVGTDTATTTTLATLSVTSTSNNIDHFTIATNDPGTNGLAFSNIVWGCASAVLPGLSINDPPEAISNNQPSLTFTVTLSAASSSNVTFAWAATDGATGYTDAAIWGTSCDGTADYTSPARTGTGTITAGQTSTTIVFGTCNNGPMNVYPYHFDTYFTVTLSNPSSATITTGTGIGHVGMS